MTYWVIAKINNSIYLTADVRASRPFSLAGYSFGDGSEKLFFTQYTASSGDSIKIGICTSGFASDGVMTIAGILHNYLEDLNRYKPLLRCSRDVIMNLRQFLYPIEMRMPFTRHYAQICSFLTETNFGIGIYFNEIPDIGGLNIITRIGGAERLVSGITYLEALFSENKYLYRMFPTGYSGLLAQAQIAPPYVTSLPKEAEAIAKIMWAARCDKHLQTISEAIDIVQIWDGGIFPYYLTPKVDLGHNPGFFQTPLTVGTDIALLAPPSLSAQERLEVEERLRSQPTR